MFFDVAKINVKGGEGGDGCMAMRREFRIEFGGPSGGNGGHGGSVWLVCDSSINTLSMLRRRVHHRGKDGTNGKGDSRHGMKGMDNIVIVPPGTIVRDEEGVLAGELNQHGQKLLVAMGGKGGRGNEHFKTHRMNAPAFAERGEEGAERWINIELKLVADVGFIGMPNAGKSTLLAASRWVSPSHVRPCHSHIATHYMLRGTALEKLWCIQWKGYHSVVVEYWKIFLQTNAPQKTFWPIATDQPT